MAITFTQLGADTFLRANENPLNPTHWLVPVISQYAGKGLQIVSDVCESTAPLGSMSNWIGSVIPADQYAEFKVTTMTDPNSLLTALVRNSANFGPCYEFNVTGLANGDSGSATYSVGQINNDGSDFTYFWGSNPIAINPGDVFRFVIIGGANGFWYAYQNGTLIDSQPLNASPSFVASGYPGLQIQTGGTNASQGMINFATGSAVANTISGTLGPLGAGLPVYYNGPSFGKTIADGSGNYSIIAALDGDYVIQPFEFGYLFSPTTQTVTVSGTNVVGVNFTTTIAGNGGLTFTPIATDNFVPDANPVNPANWATLDFDLPMQAVSGTIQQSTTSSSCGSYFIGAPTPNDQYIKVTIADWVIGSNPFPDVYIRGLANIGAGSYGLVMQDGGDGTIYYSISVYPGGTAIWSTPAGVPFTLGDVITFAVIGTNIFFLINGQVVIGPISDTTLSSGFVSIAIANPSSNDSSAFSNFVMGSVSYSLPSSYSVPDCRAVKPNNATSESVNGTLIYDVQTSSNPIIPPTDSRASEPVASGTYPQNSRTPGTFGPGE